MKRDSGRYDAILDAAELRIRRQGFHAVSFRDLADDIGIKSASVHYHFPQKADLGVALVERYSARVMKALNTTNVSMTVPERVELLIDVYRRALNNEDALCLCLMLGAESQGLPQALRLAVGNFFQQLLDWLVSVFQIELAQSAAESQAIVTLAKLQGAMALAWATNDKALFEQALS